jgi:effector-binding domain-containing protein
MKKVLKFLLYTVLAIAALVVVMGIFAKKDYQITRSIEIDAPKFIVMDQVRFFKNHPNWSPWSALDPQMKTSIEGTDGEPGAVYRWDSSVKNVGKGHQTITAVTADHVGSDIVLQSGWFSTGMPARMTVTTAEKNTKAEWHLDFHVPFPWNGLAMFTDVTKAVGSDFENGLANLKKTCEQISNRAYQGYPVLFDAEFPTRYYYGVRQTALDSANLSKFYAKNLPVVLLSLTKDSATIAGAPAGLFYQWEGGKADVVAALPVANELKKSTLQAFTVGGKPAISTDFYGPYAETMKAHMALDEYITTHRLKWVAPAIEEYVTDPATESDTAKWITRVIYFVELPK